MGRYAMVRNVALGVGLPGLLFAAAPACAGVCGILPDGPAQVELAGKVHELKAPLRPEKCEGSLRLLKGRAVLAFARADNVNDYRALKPGETIDLGRVVGGEGAISVALNRIGEFFDGGRRIEAIAGMSRGNARLAGFPDGDVLLPAGGMVLRPLAAADRGVRIRSFSVHPRGRPDEVIVRLETESAQVSIPAGALKEGQDYSWRVVLSDDRPFQGGFRTLRREDAARLEQRLEALERDPGVGEGARPALRAMILDQHRVFWNRDEALATLAATE